mmetsp:Transcript_43197/g.102005  ORF Transcript_43197/g.102005 Transcript_43197/m.102005 type:complete len:274 (+) Transcript_43197:91-912(+)
MSDAQELAELFLGYPDTSATQGTLQGYEQIYHKDFYATAPSPREGGGMLTYSREEWLATQKAIVRGLPDWTYNGRIWKPLDEQDGWDDVEEDGRSYRHIHVATQMKGTHTGDGPNLLKLEGVDYKPTGKVIVFPLEWWVLTADTASIPPKLMSLRFIKVLDNAGCSTGGYSFVNGILFAIGKPHPPAPAALQAPLPPFPPLDAVDARDPNWWQVRVELLRQISEKDDEDRAALKLTIDRQIRELQQHLDYLSALEIYAEPPSDKVRQEPSDDQ